MKKAAQREASGSGGRRRRRAELAREANLLIESVAEATRTVLGNPLRSGLAVAALAIAVGTSAVVQSTLEAVEASARAATERALGTDSFVIARLVTAGLGRREIARKLERNPPIRLPDTRFLERFSGDAVIYAEATQTAADVGYQGRRFERAAINGAGAAMPLIREIPLRRGRFFSRVEADRASQVVVLGSEVVETLFPDRDPLLQTVRIGRRGFRVIGTLENQGTVGGVSLDRYVWMPLRAFERVFGAAESLRVYATSPSGGDPIAAEDRARTTLRARRQLQPGEPDSFDIETPEASRGFVETLTARVSAAGPPISAMALLAAMLVVTNTILVSIAQRTRDIGIRRAVGAKRVHVMLEVLAESGIIAMAGGVVGLAAAVALLFVTGWVIEMPLRLPLPAALASLAAAALAGLVAGWYPARRAASIEVTRALHQE